MLIKSISAMALSCGISLLIAWKILPYHGGVILIPWVMAGTAFLYNIIKRILFILQGKSLETIVFVIACLACMVVPLTKMDTAEKSAAENRVLAKFPELSLKNFYDGTLTSHLENYFNDRFFGRELCLKIAAFYNDGMSLGTHHENVRAFSGIDNWLFYKGDNSVELYQNKLLFNDEEYPVIQQNLERKNAWLAEKGIKFYVIYLPNKEDVYSEYLGKGIKKRIRPDTDRIALLVDYLQQHNSSIMPIYPLKNLLEEKRKTDALLYYKIDTHWSPYGAYIGYEELMKSVGKDFPQLDVLTSEKMDFSQKVKLDRGDLADMLGIDMTSEMQNTWYIEPCPSDGWHYKLVEEQPMTEHNIDYRRTVNEHGKYKVLVFRDSFSTNLLPYISETFKDVQYYWTPNMSTYKNVILREKPDIVILESVSRYAQNSLFDGNF